MSLAVNLPGPIAAARLTSLGATATTVLPPSGDPLETLWPEWFAELHQGQRLLTLDLKDPDGAATLDTLLAQADILLTSSRPAALARLGLDRANLSVRHPALCQVAIVGHADADKAGHDLTYQAEAGLLTPPQLPATLLADIAGAERAVTEALAAIYQRHRTGVGGVREVALADVAEDFAEPLRRGATTSNGVLGGALATYAIYPTADGQIAVAALEPHFAERLHHALGVDLNTTELAVAFAAKPTAHWLDVAAQHDLPLAAVRDVGESHQAQSPL